MYQMIKKGNDILCKKGEGSYPKFKIISGEKLSTYLKGAHLLRKEKNWSIQFI
jgi:hypothetical protein